MLPLSDVLLPCRDAGRPTGYHAHRCVALHSPNDVKLPIEVRCGAHAASVLLQCPRNKEEAWSRLRMGPKCHSGAHGSQGNTKARDRHTCESKLDVQESDGGSYI